MRNIGIIMTRITTVSFFICCDVFPLSLHVFRMLPVPLWLDPSGNLIGCSAILLLGLPPFPPVTENSWWLWMQLLFLLSKRRSLFLWFNKLLPPLLCSCVFVSMVHLHVSFGSTFDGVVDAFLPLVFLPVSFHADVVFGCYGRIQSGWRRSSTCSGPTRNCTRR